MVDPRPRYLLQLSDCHLSPAPGQAYRGRDADATLAAVVRDALALGLPFDHLLLTGDLVHHGRADGYRRLLEWIEPLPGLHHWIPGNHDDHAAMEAAAERCPTGATLSAKRVDSGPWRLLLLNSTAAPDGRGGGALSEAELEWLAAELAQAGERHLLLVLHHNPLPTGSAWQDAIMLRNGARFCDLIERSDRVRGVICGHVHQHQHWRLGGIHLWSAPSTVFQFKSGVDDLEAEDDPRRCTPGYCHYELGADGRISAFPRWLNVWPGLDASDLN